MTLETSPVVLIAGASSGIGQAAANLFAERGWRVAATMRNTSDGAALTEDPKAIVLPLDVTAPASVETAVTATLDHFGRIDVVVNNAGYGLFGPFETATDEQIRRQFATNVDGIFAVTCAVLPAMRRQGSGTIVNVASLGGVIALPLSSTTPPNSLLWASPNHCPTNSRLSAFVPRPSHREEWLLISPTDQWRAHLRKVRMSIAIS